MVTATAADISPMSRPGWATGARWAGVGPAGGVATGRSYGRRERTFRGRSGPVPEAPRADIPGPERPGAGGAESGHSGVRGLRSEGIPDDQALLSEIPSPPGYSTDQGGDRAVFTTLPTTSNASWRNLARCRGVNPEIFRPVN